ncbi:MAG: DUF2207 domain-containing protein [Luteimonas sp.]
MRRLLLLLLALAWALPALAQDRGGERILGYDVDISVQPDGALVITERIAVRAAGRSIRRGITREFPTRYRDRHGDRVVVDFEVLEVLRNDQPEPWFTERIANGVRVNTGDDDLLQVPAEHIYTLRYRTTRQLGFFERQDELYFNAIGHGSMFPIDRGSVAVHLPAPVPVADMLTEGFTGATGARGEGFHASLPAPGMARWELTAPLAPREGFTVVLAFPKGVVAEPGTARKLLWRLKDNRAGIVALAGLAILLFYCIRRWRLVGRDPRRGIIITRYEPPRGFSPAELRYMKRRMYDNTTFSADLLAAAVDGALTIHREDMALRADRWTLRRNRPAAPGEAADTPTAHLAGLLLPGTDASLELHHRNSDRIQKAMGEHGKLVRRRIIPTLYQRNGGSLVVAALIAVSTIAATILTIVFTGSGILLAIAALLATVVATVVFAFLIGAPTPAGRHLLDEIEGFRRYLGVAEKQDLQKLEGPPGSEPELDAGRFERLLPYAVALDVEDAWTGKFTAAAGTAAVAAATSAISWYTASGRNAGGGDIGGLTRALSSGLTSQIASASSPPGSSSGSSSGGGGFSGGGGGGGGVGGR